MTIVRQNLFFDQIEIRRRFVPDMCTKMTDHRHRKKLRQMFEISWISHFLRTKFIYINDSSCILWHILTIRLSPDGRIFFSRIFLVHFHRQSLSFFGEWYGGRGSKRKMSKCVMGGMEGQKPDFRSDILFACPLAWWKNWKNNKLSISTVFYLSRQLLINCDVHPKRTHTRINLQNSYTPMIINGDI